MHLLEGLGCLTCLMCAPPHLCTHTVPPPPRAPPQVFGPESCGKSTLALHAVAEAQKAGGLAAYIDLENALDAAYAKVRQAARRVQHAPTRMMAKPGGPRAGGARIG